MLIKSCKTYFKSQTNMQKLVQMVADVLVMNTSNRQVLMPALGTMLALRDKNFDGFIGELCSLNHEDLEEVRSYHTKVEVTDFS